MTSFYETIFLKEDSTLDKKVEYLKNLGKSDQNLIKGSYGEKQLSYHLSKANIGMYVMRDINLECDDLKAQIDFVVVTSHHCYFIECKNYNADIIYVNEFGNFEESTRYGKKYNKNSINSPISQVEDQLAVFKKICLKDQNRIKDKFNDYFKTIVVFTNPDNRLNLKKAPNDIKYRVLKVDNLIRQIEYDDKHFNGKKYSQEQMKQIADYILSKNVSIEIKMEDIQSGSYLDSASNADSTRNNVNNSSGYRAINNYKRKNNSRGLLPEIVGGFGSIILVIFVLAIISSVFNNKNTDDKNTNTKKENKQIVYPAALTSNQTKAIDTFKAAYDDSKSNGFTIVHTSICYEVSKMFNNGNICTDCCNSLPMEVNIVNERQITFYKQNTNSCSTLTLSADGNSIESAINEKRECHGQPVGMVEWDDENEYYQKIGGYNQIRKMAIDSYNQPYGTFDISFFDQSHISERGGDTYSYSSYVQNVNMFFAGINGKNSLKMNTTKDNFNKMVESYYYIMK